MGYSAADYQRYREKSRRAMGRHPYTDELADRLAGLLRAGTAPPVGCRYSACRNGGPVSAEAFGGWVRDHRLAELRAHIESVESTAFAEDRLAVRLRLFAMRAAGWFRWKRRGDVTRRRTKLRWVGMRTK